MRWPAETRPLQGLVLGVVAVVVVTLVLTPIREEFSPAAPTTLLLVPVLLAAVVGGWMAAITTAIVATAALSFAFVPPLNSFRFHGDALAVPVFMMVAVIVGAVVASEVHLRRLAEESNRAALLEQVDRQRAALLRSVSHDLRTPLATIRTAASELQTSVRHNEATRDELLALVGDQAERLDRLVANLLDLSRIEAGALHPDRQAVSLGELIQDRLAGLSGVFHDVSVCVTIDPDLPLVSGDYGQLGQVLANLLENAARHSPSGGTVTATAVAGDDDVEVVIADEGKGVAPDDAAHIFEPFRTGRGSNSTGIGLAICKAVVEAHGGTIWLEPSASNGAAFHFTVPVCDA